METSIWRCIKWEKQYSLEAILPPGANHFADGILLLLKPGWRQMDVDEDVIFTNAHVTPPSTEASHMDVFSKDLSSEFTAPPDGSCLQRSCL